MLQTNLGYVMNNLENDYERLVSNDLSFQSVTKTRELRDSVNKAHGEPRIDLAERKAKTLLIQEREKLML